MLSDSEQRRFEAIVRELAESPEPSKPESGKLPEQRVSDAHSGRKIRAWAEHRFASRMPDRP